MLFPHDQLFKELLRTFFQEFLELFFPEVAAQVDFSEVRFLEQEAFTDFPDGDSRRADTVAEVRTIDGEPEVVLFHIETESWRRSVFRQRMWEYYALLSLRLKKPIYPIAIYLSAGAGGLVAEEYRRDLLGAEILSFHYKAVGLPDLSADDYQSGESVLGVALSALMRSGSADSVPRKWHAIRRILSSPLNESRKILLTNVVENYLQLADNEKQEYERLVAAESTEEVKQMISAYEIYGTEKGLKQGLTLGERRLLIKQLRVKFGDPSPAIVAKIEAMDETELDALSIRILSAESLADTGLVPAS